MPFDGAVRSPEAPFAPKRGTGPGRRGPLERLRAEQRRVIAQSRAASADRGDLLSMLVLARGADGTGMSDDEVADELITLYLSGTGTVSASLAWAVHEICSRPEVERRLPPRGTYLPFGAGNRLCAGLEFAWAQLTIAMATVVSRWRLVPDRDRPVRTLVGTVIRPDHLPMTVLP